ncbi:hypothetical protein [Methylobacterium variabile]|jgi:hypothetical protein|nr:hypothetical protein [Methylobacterium variabile]
MSREPIRNRRGEIIGYIERQSITRRRIARDARGVLVGHGDFLIGFLSRP